MKRILASITFILLAMSGHAQSFVKGQTELNASIGFSVRNISGSPRVTRKSILPVITVGAEHALGNHFGLGGWAHIYSGMSIIKPASGVGKSDSIRYTDFAAGLQCLYHLRILSRFDIYTGVDVGVNSDKTIIGAALVGAKFRVDDHWGMFVNAGLVSLGYFNAGLSYRFLGKNGG
jgi:hypothetical protein